MQWIIEIRHKSTEELHQEITFESGQEALELFYKSRKNPYQNFKLFKYKFYGINILGKKSIIAIKP